MVDRYSTAMRIPSAMMAEPSRYRSPPRHPNRQLSPCSASASRASLRVLGQSHLNSMSACAPDLNSTMPFCFALITRSVLPLSAQNADASSNAAFLTPKPFLSQHISDSEMR